MVSGMERGNGFTLIEMLVVMAVMALLVALVAPRYFSNVDRAQETVLRQNLALTRDAIDKYFADTGRYPDTLEELVTGKYLRKLPVDPVTERTDTWVLLAPEKKDSGKVFDIRSGAAGRAKDGSEYASW
jgi:general secretion pathway protein G